MDARDRQADKEAAKNEKLGWENKSKVGQPAKVRSQERGERESYQRSQLVLLSVHCSQRYEGLCQIQPGTRFQLSPLAGSAIPGTWNKLGI